MKIGMPVLYEYNSLNDNINLCKKLNLDFIELNLNFGYIRKQLQDKKYIKMLSLKKDIIYTCHFFDEADFGSFPEITKGYFKIFKKFMKPLKKLNCKLINVHLNVGPIVTISGIKNYLYEKEYDEYIYRLKTNLRYLNKLCHKINAKLVLENVKTPNFILKTYKDLKDEFTFNYDIGHDYTNDSRLLLMTKSLNILEYHIHDSDMKLDHLALSEGTMDIKMYKRMVKDAYAVLEVKSSTDLIKSIEIFRKI